MWEKGSGSSSKGGTEIIFYRTEHGLPLCKEVKAIILKANTME